MGDGEIALSGWRLRTGAFALATIAVLLTVTLLVTLSQTVRLIDDGTARSVPLWIDTPQEPRDRRPPAPQRRQPSAPAPIATAPAQVSNDPAVLARALRCFGARRGERPRDCPAEGTAQDWTGRTDLPVGGDFYRPPPVNLERVYTRAELQSLVEPPCTGVCVPIGPTPPPPSRSAEQVCRDGNLGGPCRPPEPDRVVPED